jgi:hypothetical protein
MIALDAQGKEVRWSVSICMCSQLYPLTRKSNAVSRNVGVTFGIFGAEVHKALCVENDFDTFVVSGDWREDAERSNPVTTMRNFREMVRQKQEAGANKILN